MPITVNESAMRQFESIFGAAKQNKTASGKSAENLKLKKNSKKLNDLFDLDIPEFNSSNGNGYYSDKILVKEVKVTKIEYLLE